MDSVAANPELARLRNQLSDKHDELSKLESARQQAMAEAQAKLAALLTVYTASHPSVQNAQQNFAAFQHGSPQIAALRTTVDELETKYDELAAVEADRIEQDSTKPRAATRSKTRPVRSGATALTSRPLSLGSSRVEMPGGVSGLRTRPWP